MGVKICFSIWGCGRETSDDNCPTCEGETRTFDALHIFMRECGLLPTIEAFKRAYQSITGTEAGLMVEEHYKRKHSQLSIVDEDEKEKSRDPYFDKYYVVEKPKIEVIT